MNTFFHTGDLGDIIAALPTIREMDGGELVIGHRPGVGFCRESMEGGRFQAIKPLLEAQPYITGVRWGVLERGMIDFSTFRKTEARPGENLATRQARYIGVLISHEPWIHAAAGSLAAGRAVWARSMRYRNYLFDWQGRARRYPGVFVGSPEEHADFEIHLARKVEYLPTENLLVLAETIAGSQIFIGNQSCPFWIAAGLGHPLIQETSPKVQDSIVERDNAEYPLRWNSLEVAPV